MNHQIKKQGSRAKRAKKPAVPAGDARQTPICISPEQGEAMRRCAGNCGQSVEAFVQAMILHGLEKLDGLDPLALPCPFCGKTDELEIITWSQERRDGTEYQGEAMRCHRCEAVVTMAAWMMRGLRFEHGTAACKGGAA